MRVVHIFNALYQGGAERQLELLIEETPSIEHVVISLQTINTPLSKRLKEKGVTVLFLNFTFWTVFLLPLKLRIVLNKYKGVNTVVQCWMYHGNFFGWLASRGMKLPVFWNIRRTEVPRGVTGLLSKCCARISWFSDVTIFCNSKSGEVSHSNAGYRPDSFFYIPNAIKSVDIMQVKDSNKFLVCCIGRYSKIKGYEVLLESAGVIKDELKIHKVQFLIIGRDVEMQESIKKLIDSHGLNTYFRFLGEIDDVYKVLSKVNLFCLPSLSEGFPNVLLEAMMAGLPCVATNVGDVDSILCDSDVVVQPSDITGLSQKILRMVEKSKLELDEYGKRNRELVLQRYSVEKTWFLYNKFYLEAIGSSDIP